MQRGLSAIAELLVHFVAIGPEMLPVKLFTTSSRFTEEGGHYGWSLASGFT